MNRSWLGRRRIQLCLVVASLALMLTAAVMGVVALISSPAAAPVAIAATVLSKVVDLFDSSGDPREGGAATMTAEQLAAAGDGDAVSCLPVPPAHGDEPAPSADAEETPDGEHLDGEAASPDPDPVPVPMVIGADGSLDRADAERLLKPVEPGTNSLVAQVWFLYRLAGMGDWSSFIVAYDVAGLDPFDEAADAPWRQVQALNTGGVEVQRYRLTAASLTAAGQYTGRLEDPHPGYRELVALELAATCLGEAEAVELPPPSTTVGAPPIPNNAAAETVENPVPTP